MLGIVCGPWEAVAVSVTEAHKAGARRRSCCECPVGRASRAALGNRFVSVAGDGRVVVRVDGRGDADCACDEQAAVAAWVRAWDDGGDPAPLAFTLRVPLSYAPDPA